MKPGVTVTTFKKGEPLTLCERKIVRKIFGLPTDEAIGRLNIRIDKVLELYANTNILR